MVKTVLSAVKLALASLFPYRSSKKKKKYKITVWQEGKNERLFEANLTIRRSRRGRIYFEPDKHPFRSFEMWVSGEDDLVKTANGKVGATWLFCKINGKKRTRIRFEIEEGFIGRSPKRASHLAA